MDRSDTRTKLICKDLYPITFYEYGEAYYGSLSGIRFRIAREPLENVHYTPPEKRSSAVLRTAVWAEPFSYAAADQESMKSMDFPFSQEGLESACEWLNSLI